MKVELVAGGAGRVIQSDQVGKPKGKGKGKGKEIQVALRDVKVEESGEVWVGGKREVGRTEIEGESTSGRAKRAVMSSTSAASYGASSERSEQSLSSTIEAKSLVFRERSEHPCLPRAKRTMRVFRERSEQSCPPRAKREVLSCARGASKKDSVGGWMWVVELLSPSLSRAERTIVSPERSE